MPVGCSRTVICRCSTTSGPTSSAGSCGRACSLRTSEFLWQEGHTAHETEEEALAETLAILHDVYADMIENVLAIPVLRGRKSESERFPGAVDTYTLEALMRDGRALQAATSHYLGQGFARAFVVRFTGRDVNEQYPYATSRARPRDWLAAS